MINFGIIKHSLFNILTESYLNNEEKKGETIFEKFISEIKKSDILMLEYLVISNIENIEITENNKKEDVFNYIKENLNQFKNYTKKDIISTNNTLSKFHKNIEINENYKKFYESIQNLILEFSKNKGIYNVNKVYLNLNNVYEFLENKKQNINESSKEEIEFTLNEILAITNKKLKEKYKSLNESDLKIINILSKSDNISEKKELFEDFKNKATEYIKNNKDEIPIESFNLIMETIKNMVFNNETIIDDIIKLNDLVN